MKKKELNKLIKKYSSDEILNMYMECKIYLTEKQLEKICETSSHHGGCYLGGTKWVQVW